MSRQLTDIDNPINSATKIFLFFSGNLYPEREIMKIDAENDDVFSSEESKHYNSIKLDEFFKFYTKILFNKAQMIFNIIHERLMTKNQFLREKLTAAVSETKVTNKLYTRPVYKSHGGNHLSMGRVLDYRHAGTSQSGNIISTL
jgi:hypothetical protein